MNIRYFAALAALVAALFVPSFASAQPFRRRPVAVVVPPQVAPQYAPRYAPRYQAPRYQAPPRYAPQYASPRYAPRYQAPRYQAPPRRSAWNGRRWGR